jgi:hypothetical protein
LDASARLHAQRILKVQATIFKDTPHPESAKLPLSYLFNEDYQNHTDSWSVRQAKKQLAIKQHNVPGIYHTWDR